MANFRQVIAAEGRKNRAEAIDAPHVRRIVQCTECQVWTRKGHTAEVHAEVHEAEEAAERVRQGDRVVRA